VLTPYPIPETLREQKVPNLGDGFILRAIERLVGTFAPAHTFSPRIELPPAARTVLAACPAVLIAGANQLHDQYTVWPGLTAAQLRGLRLRIVPFGIGLHGDPAHTERLSDATKDVLLAMHERIEFSCCSRCTSASSSRLGGAPKRSPGSPVNCRSSHRSC
jgi:hypothetical protein